MPISNNAFVRTTVLLLFVGFLALAGIVGTTIWLVEQNSRWFDETTEARTARVAVVGLRNALQTAESSQRGFLLTGDQAYLEPYEAALPQIPQHLEAVVRVLRPYPEAARAITTMEQAVNGKLAEMAATVELAREGDTAGALELIRTDTGQELMAEAHTFFDGIIQAADRRTIEGMRNQRGATNSLRWITVIGAFVIFAVVAGSVWIVIGYTRELAMARRQIEEANLSLEERVRERTSDLGRANEEIQRFAYIVTHDLRAPLVNIMGFTSELETSVATLSGYMAAQEGEDDPAFKEAKLAATEDLPEAITFIRAATRKMDGLINAILKISREGRRQLRPQQINLQELVDNSVAAIQHQVTEDGGSVTTDIKVPRLVSDRLSLEQALGNLFDNAVKYREPGRPLAISVRARQAAGNRIEIEIEDNGRGIAPTDHERVFELFRRSGTQTQQGEGIGLAHVRTVVRSVGGDITLRSELGVGTTFIITLPRDLRSYLGSRTK